MGNETDSSKREEKNTLRVEWNGEPHEIAVSDFTVTEVSSGHFLVSDGASVVEVFAEGSSLSDGRALDRVEIRIESARERIIRERFQGAAAKGTVKTGAHVVKAPMPGFVRAVKVAAGDLVERTSTLLVLEAMKMENNILAGATGRIIKILVEQGSSVEKNAALIEIELT